MSALTRVQALSVWPAPSFSQDVTLRHGIHYGARRGGMAGVWIGSTGTPSESLENGLSSDALTPDAAAL